MLERGATMEEGRRMNEVGGVGVRCLSNQYFNIKKTRNCSWTT